MTYAVFNRPLSQWLCRREGTFNHPPIIWELMCHTHTLDGSFVLFCFFHKTALPFFLPHVWFFLRCFLSAVITGLFPLCRNRCCVVNFDFNWFHLRFFPPLVMSLWIWISWESYVFVTFYLFLSKDDNNEIWLWFWFEPFLLFRLILIRAFPDGFDDTYPFLPIFARRHGSFSLFLGV